MDHVLKLFWLACTLLLLRTSFICVDGDLILEAEPHEIYPDLTESFTVTCAFNHMTYYGIKYPVSLTLVKLPSETASGPTVYLATLTTSGLHVTSRHAYVPTTYYGKTLSLKRESFLTLTWNNPGRILDGFYECTYYAIIGNPFSFWCMTANASVNAIPENGSNRRP